MFIFSGNHVYFTHWLSFFLYLSSLNVYLAWIKPKVGEVYTALILNI